MLSHAFLGISLVGAEWVLYVLVLLSVLSISLIFERSMFYRAAGGGLQAFRAQLRALTDRGDLDAAKQLAQDRVAKTTAGNSDLEAQMALTLLTHRRGSPEILSELAQDPVMRTRLKWEKNLAVLATIGSNAPFIGLFGTVLGIIKAFHDLSQQAATGASGVTAGISEALVATAVGLLVAIPAVIAYNIFQRRVKSALGEAEALKSYLVGKLSSSGEASSGR